MNEDLSQIQPIIFPLRDNNVTFVSHHNYLGTQPNQNQMFGGIQQQQILALQEGMLRTQQLLLEQKELNMTIAREALKLIGESKENKLSAAAQIEDKNNIPKNPQINEVIDAQYKIIKEDREEITVETKEYQEVTKTKETKEYQEVLESVARQGKNNKELPLIRQASISISENNAVAAAPVIFTVRNELWRPRTQFILKETCYNSKTGSLIRLSNQENMDCAIVFLYNTRREPEEILLILPVPLDKYLSFDEEFKDFVNETIELESLENLLLFTRKQFDLSFDHYFIVLEPKVNSASPYVLAKKGDNSMHADVIKIKPVLSFDVKEQRITFDTYHRGIIHKKFSWFGV